MTKNMPRQVVMSRIMISRRRQKSENVESGKSGLETLRIQDMRQFIQAGFLQEREPVPESNCFYVLGIPSFLEKPILTHEKAQGVEIDRKSPSPAERSVAGKKLLEMMIAFASERNSLKQFLRAVTVEPPLNLIDATLKEPIAEVRREFQRLGDTIRKVLPDRESSVGSGGTETQQGPQQQPNQEGDLALQGRQHLEKAEQQTKSMIERLREAAVACYRQSAQKRIVEYQQKLTELDTKDRSVVAKLVEASGSDAISKSDAIHACACNLQPVYIKLVMDFVPEAEKTKTINELDATGHTPLMVVALTNPLMLDNDADLDIRIQTCQTLLALGAYKNIVHASGRTALGMFRKGERDIQNFFRAFGGTQSTSAQQGACQQASMEMEKKLMPLMGPTAADNLARVEDEGTDESGDESDAS